MMSTAMTSAAVLTESPHQDATADARALPPRSKRGDAIRVRIFYQTDPDGLIPGGIPTFIRGLIAAAPDDIHISVVGLTTDERRRPVGTWTILERPGHGIPFFPVARDRDPGSRGRIPLSVKMTAGVLRYRRACSMGCDILEFHRLEPMLPFLRDRRPKNVFMHQNMHVIHDANSDIKWKHAPGVYFALERRLLPRCASVFCVRADAVDAYQQTFPNIADRFRFTPTWMDPAIFHPVAESRRRALRQQFQRTLGLSPDDDVLASVGRLDQQKDPLLLIDAFARINAARPNTRLIIVGDGVLRSAVTTRVASLGLDTRVILAGLRGPEDVAQLLQIADAFVLTSAYEGMPMAVLEALGCGVPVVTTNVGEVRRVVRSGRSGQIVDDRAPDALAQATLAVLGRGASGRGEPCVEAVREFVPERVLAPVYDNYRLLATHHAS